jgi:hypothetical protein
MVATASLSTAFTAALALSMHVTTVQAAVPNWVYYSDPSDSACYRKTYLTTDCPYGYNYDNIATCWAQCPINYPVECGMECIPQNDDCTLEILTKVNAVATVAVWAATSGVFGELSTASEAVQTGVQCAVQLYTIGNELLSYAEELSEDYPDSTEEEIVFLLEKTDFVVYDLPVAVATCLGLPTPAGLEQAAEVVSAVASIVSAVVTNADAFSSVDSFLTFISSELGLSDLVSSLTTSDVSTVTTVVESDTSCGQALETLINKIVALVQEIKSSDATAAVDVIREVISNSDVFLTEIPEVTNECVSNYTDLAEAFATRDSIRTFFETIVDNIIGTSSSSTGTPLTTTEYALAITDYVLGVIAMFDPSGIAALVAEFLEPICGPTTFLGEIDDGSLADALGLTAVDDAFNGSYGTWTKSGDGNVVIYFESTDTEDVTVNIHSGGQQIKQVKVAKGTNVTWTSTVSTLQDKTLYLDRWRPGLLGIPGTGGGSLSTWVSRSSAGGHFELHAKINVS